MRTLFLSSFIAILLGFAANLSAATFEDVDINSDGLISADEFRSAYPDASDDVWNIVDANADGSIDPAEHETATGSGILPAA